MSVIPTWVNVPPPPAPTGINVLPAQPVATLCWQGPLPDQPDPQYSQSDFEVTLTDQSLTITGIYTPIVSATASVDTPFKQTDTVTTGTSFTSGSQTTVGASLGVAGDFVSIGVSVSETTSQSLTYSQSETISQEFDIVPKSGTVTAVWWQLSYTLTISGNTAIVIGGVRTVKLPFEYVFTNYAAFASSQFPAESSETALYNRASNARVVPGLDKLFSKHV